MGSSVKKKKENKKDFQKPKLKVGKTRPKNTNHTDTSFTAKSIVLKQQSLATSAPDTTSQFNHQLSLVSSRADSQRRDALSSLTNVIISGGKLPQPVAVILPKVQPLILDGSNSVRQQLLKLLRVLPRREITDVDQLLLYTRAGMTHLSTEIRTTALDALDWLVEANGEAVVSCSGGWMKTLQLFQNLLNWKSAQSGSVKQAWTSTKPAQSLGNNKLLVKQLNSLSMFLAVGLRKPPQDDSVAKMAANIFPLVHTEQHLLGTKSNSLTYLNLFGAPRDIDSEVYRDPEERRNIFIELMVDAFSTGITQAKREGGEVGRAAAQVDKALALARDG